ncbi:hypothetical protein [Labilibaculum antarcticum]|uniref:Yip1 domain-containing protein n=1 Tax=Labilibaculum antarcticum TaxID=1717717 RepID=A0A1Y1CPU7_9BACT|nr:hypothetical protein [Labilibaculum antarcticum]BAX81972.1 hypothetical protein ALGA_3680 [Labilibaculum antarcticum]
MIQKIFNPFVYIAGLKSLLNGLLIILATSIVGYLSHTHFPDIISVKIGFSSPVWYFVVQSLLNWLSISILLYLAAIILSKSSVRMLDIFGTQALARYPYFFAAFFAFSDSMQEFSSFLTWTFLHSGEPVEISTFSVILAITLIILTLLLTIWMVTLMFNAYKISANLKGAKLVTSFIVAMIGAMILSGYLSSILIQNIQ